MSPTQMLELIRGLKYDWGCITKAAERGPRACRKEVRMFSNVHVKTLDEMANDILGPGCDDCMHLDGGNPDNPYCRKIEESLFHNGNDIDRAKKCIDEVLKEIDE